MKNYIRVLFFVCLSIFAGCHAGDDEVFEEYDLEETEFNQIEESEVVENLDDENNEEEQEDEDELDAEEDEEFEDEEDEELSEEPGISVEDEEEDDFEFEDDDEREPISTPEEDPKNFDADLDETFEGKIEPLVSEDDVKMITSSATQKELLKNVAPHTSEITSIIKFIQKKSAEFRERQIELDGMLDEILTQDFERIARLATTSPEDQESFEKDLYDLTNLYKNIDELEDTLITKFSVLDEKMEDALKEQAQAYIKARDIASADEKKAQSFFDSVVESKKRIMKIKKHFETSLQKFFDDALSQMSNEIENARGRLDELEEKFGIVHEEPELSDEDEREEKIEEEPEVLEKPVHKKIVKEQEEEIRKKEKEEQPGAVKRFFRAIADGFSSLVKKITG